VEPPVFRLDGLGFVRSRNEEYGRAAFAVEVQTCRSGSEFREQQLAS
jgi:hypothetical protein